MRTVVVHPNWGIFIGQSQGMTHWSNLDPVAMPAAYTFRTKRLAEEFIKGLTHKKAPRCRYVEVNPSDGEYATIPDLDRIGLTEHTERMKADFLRFAVPEGFA